MKPRFRHKARRAGLGALPVLAGFLLASAILRLGDGTAIAMASEVIKVTQAHASAPEQADEEIATLLSALEAREADLDARAEELEAEADQLNEAREALSLQLEEIEAAELELRELLQMADRAAEDDLSRLATVYENMKPAEAAPLFEQMPPAFAAGFMGLMSPAASAAILANMPADVAYAISVMLAGRHADLPKE